MAKNQKMSKMQQIDFLLLRKIESVELPKEAPRLPAKVVGGYLGLSRSVQAYWFERGRREAFMEIRVMLRTEMGA